jgi:Protein of unknown function (DUF3592)
MPTATNIYPLISQMLKDVVFALLLVLLVAICISLKRFPLWFRSARSAGWPSAWGTVETASVSTFSEQSLGELAYSFAVAGERYAGHFSRQFADQQDAFDYVQPLKGRSILVRYRPDNPNVSAVRLSDQDPLFTARHGSFSSGLVKRFLELLGHGSGGSGQRSKHDSG